ncbi:MAG: pilus (MSHA type) biogenesis protein MshL [Hydrogenophilales bacterium 16-64-46]|nr:MAG: pilus (MSHA type) biogenesis protein MshL [Hydrogenophilales bacterium 12-64-13]OYZ06133.1 MAG: pilus (MSHA type) biogenesis protein MshL [Hydrogenophilales bacterium 16-64-46]OZA38968.1 MAG: pilus (MSHA type) biogenesis protein MshL [Hydrogenophilales bacterium 17-64-34]HQT01018.1 pilus (MSHA type) biogenesis protein MshL [Thiobacillus sp.]
MNNVLNPAPKALVLASLLLTGCVPPQAFDTSPGHISQPAVSAAPASAPPAPVRAAPTLPPPQATAPVPTYTVVVNDVPVKDLLFSIARDTQYNIDLHPGISGKVSLNAVQEPLPAILDRIARQANLRYEMNGRTVSVMPDTPYAKTYTVNYVNVARNTTSSVGVAAQIASTGVGSLGNTASSSSTTGNSSTTTVASQSNNDLWTVLADNIRTMLAGTRAVTQSSEERSARLDAEKATQAALVSQTEAASKAGAGAANLFKAAFANQPLGDGKHDVAVNPVAGTVTVLGTSRQQELVQQYLDRVMQSAQRQVLIEATIVEVSLKDQYRAGIDWSKALQGATGWSITTPGAGTNALAGTLAPFIQATYSNAGSNGFTAAIDLLESYGKTRVLSSPKLMALNNQTALLKVVNNLVYFNITANTTTAANVAQTTTFTSTPQTVPVGIVMSVLPQINEDGMVSLTVRPTISRQVGLVNDPNPELKRDGLDITNSIPVIQVREMESLLQVRSGQTVILGGLIQDDSSNARDGLPVLSRPEGIGALFGQHERLNSQTELVIFLRPTVVARSAPESEELQSFQRLLPAARSTP